MRRFEFGSFDVALARCCWCAGFRGQANRHCCILLAGCCRWRAEAGTVSIAAGEIAGLPSPDVINCALPVVGWMPQRLCLIETLTVRENVLLPLALAGKSDARAAASR